MEDLCCNTHEEADTRIFVHVASCQDSSIFVIHATDTDIILLAMYHLPRLQNVKELWVEKNNLFLPISDLVSELTEALDKDPLELTATLRVSYVVSGCDSVSYPFGRGKKRAANVALQRVGTMPQLTDFSHTDSCVDIKVFDEARDYFCQLYGRPGSSSLDRLRAHLFLPVNEIFVLCLLLRMHFTIMFSEVFVKSICTSKQIYATQPFYHWWNTADILIILAD